MHSATDPVLPMRWRSKAAFALCAAAVALLGCRPSAQECATLMPVITDDLPILVTSPANADLCVAHRHGVAIQVEAIRDGLSWRRGRIWIAGYETPLPGVEVAVQRNLVARSVRGAHDTIRRIREVTRGVLDGIRDSRRR
jgi:hypothetical protein